MRPCQPKLPPADGFQFRNAGVGQPPGRTPLLVQAGGEGGSALENCGPLSAYCGPPKTEIENLFVGYTV